MQGEVGRGNGEDGGEGEEVKIMVISLGEVKVYTTEDNAVLRVISYIGLHPTEKFCIHCITRLPTKNHAPIAWKLIRFHRNFVCICIAYFL